VATVNLKKWEPHNKYAGIMTAIHVPIVHFYFVRLTFSKMTKYDQILSVPQFANVENTKMESFCAIFWWNLVYFVQLWAIKNAPNFIKIAHKLTALWTFQISKTTQLSESPSLDVHILCFQNTPLEFGTPAPSLPDCILNTSYTTT